MAVEALEVLNGTVKMGEGYTVNIEHRPIIAGVVLDVYDGVEAVLRIGGMNIIEFAWNDYTRAIFDGIDTVEPIELLEALNRFQII